MSDSESEDSESDSRSLIEHVDPTAVLVELGDSRPRTRLWPSTTGSSHLSSSERMTVFGYASNTGMIGESTDVYSLESTFDVYTSF